MILPKEYKELEYIETNNYGNYIDTLITPTQDTKLEVSYMDIGSFEDNPKPYLSNIFGASSSTQGAGISIGMAISGTLILRFDGKTFTVPLATTGVRITDISSKDGYFRNDEKINDWGAYTDFDFEHNIYLFATNSASDSPSSWQRNIRVYYAKIYENDILVRNLVPALRKSDKEIGMYDLVSKTFFENSGLGTFTYKVKMTGLLNDINEFLRVNL